MRHTDLCPPCLERDTLTNFLAGSHISTVLRQFPSYCSVRKSRCASRGLFRKVGDMCQIEQFSLFALPSPRNTCVKKIASCLREENRARKTKTRNILETAIVLPYYVKYPPLPLGEYDFHGLCCSLVVMVQSPQHRNGEYLMRLGRWRSRKRQRLGNPLPKPLMRSSLIEIQDRDSEEAGELLLMEDQKVIQAFSPHA